MGCWKNKRAVGCAVEPPRLFGKRSALLLRCHPRFQLVSGEGDSVVKNLPASAEDAGSSPGSGRSPGGGNGNPLQYSCPDNRMDRGAWQATVHGVTKSQT
ncbi:hypothetical protein R6Z07F_019292 [Ovis aries]